MNTWLLLNLVALTAFAENSVPLTTMSVTVPPPPKVVINGELVVTEIVEIPLIKQATIKEPRFVFDQDFGYGLEILPDLTKDSWVAEWICQKYGYSAVVYVKGKRKISNSVYMVHVGDPKDELSKGLTLESTSQPDTAANVVCKMM